MSTIAIRVVTSAKRSTQSCLSRSRVAADGALPSLVAVTVMIVARRPPTVVVVTSERVTSPIRPGMHGRHVADVVGHVPVGVRRVS